MIKGPILVSLNFRTGMVRRYHRRFDQSGAGLGWQVEVTHEATFDVKASLPVDAVEQFRATGRVG